MKSFQKIALLSLTPVFVTGIISFLIAGSFTDFLPKTIFFTVGFSVITSLIYLYVFEKLQHRKNSILKNTALSILSIFLSIFLFGIVWQALFLNDFILLTAIYQGLLGVFILCILIGLVSIFRTRNSENILHFKEKPQNYVGIVMCISFIHTLFISSFYIESYSINELVKLFIDNYLKALLSTSMTMLFLFIFSNVKFTKSNIYINISLTSIIAYLFIYAIEFPRFNLLISIIRLFTIGFSTTIFCVMIIIYRNTKNEALQKISKLTNLVSKKNSEYLQLKNQVNPHFLFNNLNTLISFIEIEPKKAIEFGHHLSNVYRHYLKSESDDCVLLSDELQFINDYLEIYKAKFESGFSFEINNDATENLYILSFSLQEIIDNIFKHTILDEEKPIKIRISLEENYLKITNSLNPQNKVISTNKGLQNINNRNKILINKEIIISKNESSFEIKIPTLKLEN